jgi:hypothetical protein
MMEGRAALATWTTLSQAFDSAASAASLTEDQQNWILLLMSDVRDEHGAALDQLTALRSEMGTARGSGDREAMRGLMGQMGTLMQALAPTMTAFGDEVRGTLSGEQVQALDAFIRDRSTARRRP